MCCSPLCPQECKCKVQLEFLAVKVSRRNVKELFESQSPESVCTRHPAPAALAPIGDGRRTLLQPHVKNSLASE